MPALNEFTSSEEAAEKLKDPVEFARRMIREGSIEGAKIGRTWLVRRANLDGYMKRPARMARHYPSHNK
jgi:excisionase family DNA binding protein